MFLSLQTNAPLPSHSDSELRKLGHGAAQATAEQEAPCSLEASPAEAPPRLLAQPRMEKVEKKAKRARQVAPKQRDEANGLLYMRLYDDARARTERAVFWR